MRLFKTIWMFQVSKISKVPYQYVKFKVETMETSRACTTNHFRVMPNVYARLGSKAATNGAQL